MAEKRLPMNRGMGMPRISVPKGTFKRVMQYVIKNYKLSSCGHFENNQVCCGGVNLNCLDNNLQCKTNKNLYFIGEVVNVDGVCGGYNLQWAFTSGKIVGEVL